MFDLNDDNFEEFAIANYDNPNCVSVLEFLDDLKKIRYIKRLLNKYAEKRELKERLILNHIIFLTNVFGVYGTVNMLTYKIDDDQVPFLNSFLVFLNYYDSSVEHDLDLLDRLKELI